MASPDDDAPPAGRPAATAAALGLALFAAFAANGRMIGAGDVVPATLLPVALVRGDGPVLDRFAHALREPDGRVPGYATEERGHIVSRYPIGAAILAIPLVLPQVVALDLRDPGWEADGPRALRACARMAKRASAALAALGGVALLLLLRGLGLGRAALPATLIATLGSDVWAVASQAPWQHGPAALCLTLAAWLLARPSPSRGRLALAGLATAGMVVCRPIDVVFAAALAVWALRRLPRAGRRAFLAPAAAVAALLAAYNLYFFDTLTGGYAQLEKFHGAYHGIEGTWTGPFLDGASGTLLSPSRGLLTYCPWVALALATLPLAAGRLPAGSPLRPLLWSLIPYFVLLSKYSCWWAGHSFGPRFWVDAVPVLAVALGLGLDWAADRYRPMVAAFAAAGLVAAAAQGVGVACYPSSWHGTPTNADLDHARLWDSIDSELTRCVREGVRRR